MEKLLPLTLPPGLLRNGTAYQAKGRWTDADKVRFFNGTIGPIGGWLARTITGAANAGVPRGAAAWTPDVNGTAQAPVLAYGTTEKLFVVIGSVRYDITPTDLATDTTRVWTLEVFGAWLIAVAWSSTDYTKHQGMYVWQGDPTAVAEIIAPAPISPTGVVVTAERFVFQLGGVDPLGQNFPNYPTVPSTRTVLWPSQETLTDWTPTAENSAGSFPLATNHALLCGKKVRGETLLLTTGDVHRATYISGEFLYRFEQIADECGVVSPRAAITASDTCFWMGEKSFFVYGGYVKAIPCEVEEYVFGSFNKAYKHLVWGHANTAFTEVTWYYPSGAATEVDRYVTFNYGENHWTTGTLRRTAGVAAQAPGSVPVLLDIDGTVYDHETGTAMGGATPYAESGAVELGDGDQVMRVQSVIPDEKTLGDVNLRLYTKLLPHATETTYGPYTLTARTDVRVTARSVRIRLSQVVAAAWRVGVIRLGVIAGGMR